MAEAMRGIMSLTVLAIIVLAGFYEAGVLLSTGSEGETIVIRGAGSSFLQPQLEAWIQGFMRYDGKIIVEYQSVGSGAGQKQFFQGLADFAGSDPPLSHDDWEKYRGKVLQLPVILGAVAVVYNIPDIPKSIHLNLTGEILAGIYKGTINYWDDPKIKSINPGIADKLPHREIIAVHRSDASGTTQIFTTFLRKSAPSIWPKDLVGKTIDWPVDKTGRGVGGKGNPGVTATILSTPYSIGYVELAYALEGNLGLAAIRNKDGVFVLPSPRTIKAAARHALESGLMPSSPEDDFSGELNAIIYAGGSDSYPITAFSHIIIWAKYNSEAKAEALRLFIQWIYTEGLNYIVEGYVAVPPEVARLGLQASSLMEG